MCLYITQKETQIAQEDITCYKVLETWNPEWDEESGHKRKIKKTVFRSYFYPNFKWNIDKHYRSRLVIEPRHMANNYSVNEAFHSYQTLESAKSFCKSYGMCPCVIARCIIPKGAKYCEGTNSDSTDGYASNQIIIKEIVDFKELYPDFDRDKYPYKQGQLLLISDSSFPNGEILRVNNIIPLDSNTVRVKVGLTFYCDTDINGIPVLPTAKIQVYNDKETE